MNNLNKQPHELDNLMPCEEWRTTRGVRLFPTADSFEWFCRNNRDLLIDSGALIPRMGRGGNLAHAGKMSDTVLAHFRDSIQRAK
ncbi:hypothetical protein EYC87_05250 [Halieaceae bacterium IMCC8485]|uniref:Uncharacterized protein n=1 Tax=Candidatus Seongchinamella marina TaxID=2518990 RepID=A0ABT3SSS6_9GAMM|nr:hypothetical protein [Candidatus Seongchinamella marina]MCX2972990.1 hypothetical protein [Candidatus Seongchinamella marina]